MGWIYFVCITPGVLSEYVKMKPRINKEEQQKPKKEISLTFLMENFRINWIFYGFLNSFFEFCRELMQIFQMQNNKGEQILLLLSMVFAVLLRNPDSNQRSSMANTEEKRKQTTKNAQSKKP